MKRKNNKEIEILAPAGSFDILKAAIASGADAVYVGGSRFGARAYAQNFTEEELLQAIDYVHLYGKKLYLTINTLIKEQEFSELYDYLLPYYKKGLDAVIVQDHGVMCYVKKQFPGLAIHASTQMTITNVLSAKYVESLGVERVVPARELSLREIKEIAEQTDLEIECFVHGALCYCYSGQCLLSSMIGGRSGNRGQCAQPCRLPYRIEKDKQDVDIMSLKDLCTIDRIPELIQAGITSFKIEGRMKQPQYVATVTSMYRKYVDRYFAVGEKKFRVESQDRKRLEEAFQRRGYTDGYYKRHNGPEMISYERPEGTSKPVEYRYEEAKQKIHGYLKVKVGEPLELTLTYETSLGEMVASHVSGDLVEPAMKQPLSKERIEKQMKKTGNTPFVFEELYMEMEGDVFLSMQSMNDLRRRGIQKLEQNIYHLYERKEPLRMIYTASSDTNTIEKQDAEVAVSVETVLQMKSVVSYGKVNRIYIEDAEYFSGEREHFLPWILEARQKGICVYLAMARIFRNHAKRVYEKEYAHLEEMFDGVLFRNLEEYVFLREKQYKKPLISDSSVYQWNKQSNHFWMEKQLKAYTAPVELHYRELKQLSTETMELIVYGYLPVMVTAGCIYKNRFGCEKKEKTIEITDRYRKKFMVKNHCIYCYNTIYNTDALLLFDQKQEIEMLQPKSLRLVFTKETKQQVKEVLDAFYASLKDGDTCSLSMDCFTRGHFKRGVK